MIVCGQWRYPILFAPLFPIVGKWLGSSNLVEISRSRIKTLCFIAAIFSIGCEPLQAIREFLEN